MKKVFFTLALAVSTLALSAQSMWVGGTAGVWSNHINGGDSELSFKVMPEFGFILSDDIAVGIAIGGGHTHVIGVNSDGVATAGTDFVGSYASSGSVNIYKVNPFVRYTFLKSSLGGLFFDGGVGYEYQKGCGFDYKTYGIEVGFRPGVAINLSSKFALIGKFGFLGYQHKKDVWVDLEYGDSGNVRSNNFGFDFNLENIQLGGVFKF